MLAGHKSYKMRFCPNIKIEKSPSSFQIFVRENLKHERRRYIVTPHTLSPLPPHPPSHFLSLARALSLGVLALSVDSLASERVGMENAFSVRYHYPQSGADIYKTLLRPSSGLITIGDTSKSSLLSACAAESSHDTDDNSSGVRIALQFTSGSQTPGRTTCRLGTISTRSALWLPPESRENCIVCSMAHET